jgi:hypothetical protein
MEVRYIVFAPDEVRSAIIAFAQKRGHTPALDRIAAVELIGPSDDPTAILRLRVASEKNEVKISGEDLVAALLLYCVNCRIPIHQKAAKKVELSVNGLTLVLTTDQNPGSPVVANDQIRYGVLASKATERVGSLEDKLAQAVARADYFEGRVDQAERRARIAEEACGKAAASLVAIQLIPGIRGRFGRWLVKFWDRKGDDCEWLPQYRQQLSESTRAAAQAPRTTADESPLASPDNAVELLPRSAPDGLSRG